jgi:hypothetical protein
MNFFVEKRTFLQIVCFDALQKNKFICVFHCENIWLIDTNFEGGVRFFQPQLNETIRGRFCCATKNWLGLKNETNPFFSAEHIKDTQHLH